MHMAFLDSGHTLIGQLIDCSLEKSLWLTSLWCSLYCTCSTVKTLELTWQCLWGLPVWWVLQKKKTSQWLVHLRPFPSGLLSRLCMKSSVMVKLHLRWGYPYIGIRAGEFTFTVETHPVASLSRCYLRGPFLKNEMISFTVFTRCSWLQLIKKQIFVYSVNFLILIVN